MENNYLNTASEVCEIEENEHVNNPNHYQSMLKNHNIDCITAMLAAFGVGDVQAFCKLNAFKYIWRETSKGGDEDIEKALWYLNKYLELNKKQVDK